MRADFDKLRAGDVLVVRWVDRSARIYEDVCDPICEFMRRGVAIRTVVKNFTFDGATGTLCRGGPGCALWLYGKAPIAGRVVSRHPIAAVKRIK